MLEEGKPRITGSLRKNRVAFTGNWRVRRGGLFGSPLSMYVTGDDFGYGGTSDPEFLLFDSKMTASRGNQNGWYRRKRIMFTEKKTRVLKGAAPIERSDHPLVFRTSLPPLAAFRREPSATLRNASSAVV